METNGKHPSRPDAGQQPRVARRIAVITFFLMLVPVGTAAFVFPALSQGPFASADDIDPAKLKWLSVRLFNRTDLDGGVDIGPYYAAADDYAGLLAPLRGATPVNGFDDARGPWLGEYRMRTTEGRPATVRLYWHRGPQDPPSAPARVRFQVGGKWFEGGPAAAVIAAADAAVARGTK
ncbi:MAG: hypothetical protein ACRC7O_00485 [Fimbriiglobus sp.]